MTTMNINDFVLTNLIVLKFAGLYPVNIIRYSLCISCLLLIIVPQVAQIYQHRKDLSIVLETSSVLFTILLALLKSSVWIFNQEKIQSFIDYMMTDFWQIVQSCNTNHLKVYATYAKRVTKGYVFLICNALLVFYSLPVIDRIYVYVQGTADNSTKSFPFVALYPSSYYNFPYYELTYISQMMATSVCAIMILATDTLIATALFHTTGHFKIIQSNLQDLDRNILRLKRSGSSLKSSEKNLNMIKEQMLHIIKHHQTVLWFCDNTESNFNPMLLLQTLASSLIICLVGFQVATTLTERFKIVKYFSYLLMALFQLLLFCFPGDMLLQESFAINRAVYSIRWYEVGVSLRSEVHMLISRAQKPSHVTAGGFYVMHLENFNAVLSTALSYFMMLRSFNTEN